MARRVWVLVSIAAASLLLACGSSTTDGQSRTNTGTGGSTSGGTGGSSSTAGTTGGGTGGGGSTFDAGTAPDRNMVKAGAVCARIATIQCAGEAACCTMPKETVAECVQNATAACNGTLMLDDVSKAQAVAFDATAASTAFTELEQRASKCDPAIAAWALSTDGFEKSFAGTKGKDEDCTPPMGLTGSMLDISVALASCRLADGLACMPTAMKWTCLARAGNGGACFSDLNCQDGLYCNGGYSIPGGKCTARKAAGSDCAAATECSSSICTNKKCSDGTDVQGAYCLK